VATQLWNPVAHSLERPAGPSASLHETKETNSMTEQFVACLFIEPDATGQIDSAKIRAAIPELEGTEFVGLSPTGALPATTYFVHRTMTREQVDAVASRTSATADLPKIELVAIDWTDDRSASAPWYRGFASGYLLAERGLQRVGTKLRGNFQPWRKNEVAA
jgi:hypothetical protein